MGKIGFGFVCRGSDGVFLDAVNGNLEAGDDPFLAEALSMREALSWLKERNYSNVCFESDSLLLIAAIRSTSLDSSHAGSIIIDCKILA